MFIFKILLWIGLIVVILSGSYFTGILTKLGTAINTINSDFWAYLPTDIRIFFLLLTLGLLFGLVYAFKK